MSIVLARVYFSHPHPVRSQPTQTPADAKETAAGHQRGVDLACGRQLERGLQNRPGKPFLQRHPGKRNSHCSSQHKHQGWVPVAGEVQKRAHSGGIGHPAKNQAYAERQAAAERCDVSERHAK
ncbi:hypothetical protein KL916_000984 [Ogataea parapolymorpha]|nr:hypothetical protein KL916_000984 [Ogataea parapolymorpha]